MGFFENLTKKAQEVVGKAHDAVETGCERIKLSQDIQAHSDALNALFSELGRLTYHGNAELAGVRPKQEIVNDITAAAEKLQALNEQYEELTSPKEEPEIDLKAEPSVNCFCHKCGTKLNK